MRVMTERPAQQIGSTRGCEDHDYDLVHELNTRLNFLWRCDQYVANAEGNAALQNLWRDLKKQELGNVD